MTGKVLDKKEIEALNGIQVAIEVGLQFAPVDQVFSILTGAFVGLASEIVRRQGFDQTQAIELDGGSQRDITIHATKKLPEGQLAH